MTPFDAAVAVVVAVIATGVVTWLLLRARETPMLEARLQKIDERLDRIEDLLGAIATHMLGEQVDPAELGRLRTELQRARVGLESAVDRAQHPKP